MNPHVELNSDSDKDDALLFTLSGVNVSLANAIRRTILSDIPLVVFKTAPYEENKANIIANTTRLNNEILKKRLSCIPIYIKNTEDFPLKNYMLEVNVENITDTTMYVTTKDFIIKDVVTGKPVSETKTREIFPANDYTGYFIDFARLRPKISDEIPGEKINLTCEFSLSTAKVDGMFNAVSSCAYGFTIDTVAQDALLEKLKQTWKDEGKTEAEIKFEVKNWKLLDGLRVTKKDSFDYTIQSIGVYTNYEMSNSFDIILENEDYTIGKVLEYFLYTKFYETKTLTFCGFKKMHPHDSYSIIRVAYKDAVDKSSIKGNLKECIEESKQVFEKIKKEFLRFVKN